MTPIEKARQLGTYNADDRSRQYPLDHQRKVEKAINECWTKVHKLERTVEDKDRQIGMLTNKLTRQWVLNVVLTLSVFGLWELVKFLVSLQLR